MAFYKINIDQRKKNKYAYAIGIEDNSERIIYCSECKNEKKIKSIFDTEADLSIVLSNDNYADFLWNYIILISEKTIEILKNEMITGYCLKNIRILSHGELSELKKRN